MEKETAKKVGFFDAPLFRTRIKSANIKFSETVIGYLIGPFGALLASGIFTAYLNNYWTDVLFSGSDVTTFLTLLPALSTILIVVGNIVVGQLIEKTVTPAGKARPWILLASVLLGVSCILMFTVPLIAEGSDVGKMVLTAISYNLYYSVAFPMYNTANSTLVPVSTRNPNQRSLLASFTNLANLAVMGAGSMIFPLIASLVLKRSAGAWAVAFIIIGILSFVVTVLQYYFTRERVTEETIGTPVEVKKIPMGQQMKACFSEKYWWIILGFYIFFQFSGAIKNLSMVYFCKYVVDNSFWGLGFEGFGTTQTLLGVAGAIPMAIAMLFIWPLSKKTGKQIVVIGGMLVGVVGGIIAGSFYSSPVLVTIGVALKCFGSAPACYMILAMISDMLDHMEARNGFRCDGFTMSVYSSIMVASTPIMTAVFNAILGGVNYDAAAFQTAIETGVGISGGAISAINWSYVWIETVAYAVCAIILAFFIVERFLKKDQETIKARQKAEVEAAGGVWEDPADRLKREEEEAIAASEEARKAELKAKCEKKGLNYEEEEAKYQAKIAAKKKKK